MRLSDRLSGAGRWLFADRYGLVLWLAFLCWFGLTWRVGFFIQDTYAIANTLVALADGQLQVTELRYSITFNSQPGLHQYDGRLYGRNYGHLALAVPLVWALEGFASLADPRLLLAGLWAGVGLVLVTQLSQLERFDRRRTRTAGAAVVGVLFLVSVTTATDLPRDRLALVAYQLSTLLAAATAGLLLYRLGRRLHGRRVGLAAGCALAVATPMGFWATIPKRHTLVATLTLGAVYAFAVSRQREGREALQARAGAYALAGFITSIHAFEALFVVVTLGVVDLLTARTSGIRELLVVGFVLLLAVTPMAATNYAITGNPAEPPRLLPTAGNDVEFSPVPEAPDGGGSDGGSGGGGSDGGSGGGGSDGGSAAGGSDGGSGGGGSDGGNGGGGSDGESGDGGSDGGATDTPLSVLLTAVQDATGTISTFAGEEVVAGVRTLNDTDRLRHTFVRSGTIPSVKYSTNEYETIELSLLEAMPMLGALTVLPVLVTRRLRHLGERSLRDFDPRTASPSRKTDLLVVVLAVVMTVVYLPRLPLQSTLTVRYLHPVVPLAAYGVFRIPAVRRGVAETSWLCKSSLVSLGFALVVLLGGIVGMGLAVGEAVQYNALWNLAAAVVCAGAVVGHTLRPAYVPARVVAVAVALPAAFTTAYLLLSGLVYFRYGSYAFDIVATLAEVLPAL